ncbi:DHA2 family efflux MFS transporter permease subunit [Aquamicrobium defluvii]|uniref:EmrB/QacA subfamily drug resistance transporter n=1 Tax=Aquamicrobium defluvii TaxID=69279 RepID=A0A011U124_9HYPH|nr:DHA2 family efflux MFS transporter permease subunit [Aquamicrobium defluvii]EXL10107.1 multidrug MFS transporter [Aquamicrobium defluvii]EZQ16883.1 multidrug MFS transporter [Halopseudomonas bauzanensis]TDR36430.1 EmrB/QacA subfamily drug resistance transporter [Aquamicrobium defluvii]
MSSIEDLFDRYGPSYRWLATGTVMIATIAVVLSTTIVNVAIPDVMGAFGISQVQAQWLSTGFLAAMTATMLVTDWADRAFGQRATMVGALAIFMAGSVLGGVAPNETVLTIARVIQGAAAGVVQPLAMILLFQVFPPNQRGAAMGIFGIGVVLAPALGPWIGGLLIDAFSWRYVFYLGIPFAVVGILLANLFLPARKDTGARPGFDWGGMMLLCIFLGTLLNALTNAQRLGWSSDPILIQFAVAVAALAGFIWWEMTTGKPMLDLRLFANVPFSSASLVAFIMGAGLFGSTYLVPLFVQTIQGLTPTQAGLLLMPSGFVLVLIFPIAGRLSDKVPAGFLIGAGMLIFAWSSWLTVSVSVDTAFWTLAWWVVISRIGLGLLFPSLTAGSLKVLPRELVAQGSGAINFIRQLGGAFGVNLLAVFLERRTVYHSDALTATQTSHNPATMDLLQTVAGMAKAGGLPDHQQLPAAIQFLGQVISIQANTLAFHDGFLIVTLVFLVALIPTWMLHRAQRKPHGI